MKRIVFDPLLKSYRYTDYALGVDAVIPHFNTYTDLPPANLNTGKVYYVTTSSGTWWLPGSMGGTYYPKGLYYSNGVTWETTPTPWASTQSEVDNVSNNDTFVTPVTLDNAAKWSTKADINHSHISSDITDFDNAIDLNPTVQSLVNDSHIHTNKAILDQITEEDYNILTNSVASGLITGGHISINTLDNTKFDISAGSGIIVDNTSYPPVKTFVSWPDLIAQSTPFLTTDTNTFIAIDSNGLPVLTNALQDYNDTVTVIILGWVEHTNNLFIQRYLDEPYYTPDLQQQFQQFLEALKAFNINGNELSANGANLKLNISSGTIFDNGTGYSINQHAVNIYPTPAINSVSIKYFYRDGLGDWVNDNVLVTDVNSNVYDDGSGILQNIPVGRWIIQRVYYYGPFGYLDVYHSQTTYSTKEEALNAIVIESFEENPYLSYDIPIGVIITQQGATDLSNITTTEIRKLNKSSLGGFSNNIGEANTAGNIGTSGVGVYKQKTGVTLEFKKLDSLNPILSIIDDATNNKINFNLSQATSLTNGYLSAIDWNIFNNKQNALGFTPENVANKQNNLTASSTNYPTVDAVNTGLNTKEPNITAGTTSQYWRGDKSWQILDKSSVGLSNVDNTSDNNKPVSTAQATAISLKEDSANKSTSTSESASTTKFPVWSAIVAFFSATQIKSILGITTLSGSNTGDETNATIISKIGYTPYNATNPNNFISTISGITAGGDLSGTYPNPAILNSAVLAKVLTGLNITGSTISASDTIIQAFGKLQNQINGVLGGATYQSTWNAATNTPLLSDGSGTKGHYYVVSNDGAINLGSGSIDFKVGDWAIYNGSIWQKVDNTDAVTSVNGQIGPVTLTTANISEVTNLYFTTSRVLATQLSGYISGAGTISATDTILQAIQKLNGNINALTTANIPDSANKRYVTDSQLTVISNTSNTNTGDETTATIQAKRPLKTVNGTSLEGSGNIAISSTTNLTTSQTSSSVTINSDTGTDATIPLGNGTNAGVSINDYTTTEKNKLSGIAAGATANSSDATLLNRANHTGTQLSSTISDLQETVEDIIGTKIISGTNISVSYNDVTGITTISSSGGSATPGGSAGQIQYNNGGAFAGATNVKIDNNDLSLTANASPVTPSTDNIKLFGKLFGPSGSRVMPAAVGPSGMDYTLQPSLWRQKISRWNPSGNSATVPGIDGLPAPTTVGTATARSVATTNTLTRAKRLGYVSAATAGSLCGHYITAAQYTVGTGSSTGGFFYSCRFGISDATIQTVANGFIGLSSGVAVPTNIDPATLTNSIGIGHTNGDTNFFLYYGGSTAQTRINLGASFPINNTNFMDFTLWSPPNQNGVVYYRLEIIGTSTVIQGTLGPGTLGVTLPANTTLLTHRAWRCNNTAAVAVGIDISSIYFETDW